MSCDIFHIRNICYCVDIPSYLLLYFKMCPVYFSVTHFSIAKFQLVLFRKAKFFFTVIIIKIYPTSQVIYFYSNNILRIIVFNIAFIYCHVFHSGMVLKTILQEIQNKIKWCKNGIRKHKHFLSLNNLTLQ